MILFLGSPLSQSFSAPNGPATVQFYEVPFESVSRDILENFHKKHPNEKGQRVLARASRGKVTHYKVEFTGSDAKTISVVESVKDVATLTVEWLDTNKDGSIDLQKHTFSGTADRDEMLKDEDFDGFFDTFTLFGAGISETPVHIAVPKPVEMQNEAMEK
ncbi:MAG: hypothetical protein V4662_20045 [Verrucomicrobiota bacterium]